MIAAVEKPEHTEINLDKIEKNGFTNTYNINTAPLQVKRSQNVNDTNSICGRFGWITLEQKHHIPHILRGAEKYCAVRMLETIFAPYLKSVSYDICCKCINIKSYYTTVPERKLLNEINSFHCDYQFGKTPFSQVDVIIRSEDVVGFHKFLIFCHQKLNRTELSDNFGFIKINDNSVVPFIMYNKEKHVPLFYLEGAEHLKARAKIVNGWYLCYLKFCYKIQGIREEYFDEKAVAVISLDIVKQYFPLNSTFEDFWPDNIVKAFMSAVDECKKLWYCPPNLETATYNGYLETPTTATVNTNSS